SYDACLRPRQRARIPVESMHRTIWHCRCRLHRQKLPLLERKSRSKTVFSQGLRRVCRWFTALFAPDMIELQTRAGSRPMDSREIDSRLALCPSLPSLSSINKALQSLLFAEQRFSAQISEVIRRDPSLSSRLLRLVNSVYYGLTTPVNSIEEAVFYLG